MPNKLTVLPAGKLKYIHVSQPSIRANVKKAKKEPVIRIKYAGKNYSTNAVNVKAGEFIYSPDKPILSCGARLVFKTSQEVSFFQQDFQK